MLRQIALVSLIKDVSLAETARTSAALQKQVARDLAPIWGVQACVSAFASVDAVPVDYWPVLIASDIQEPGMAGMHLDRHGRPFCLVEHGPTWSLAASHECIAMLIDPGGNRQISGPSPVASQGEVAFLVEACDACADAQHGYTIDGVLVSDFCTPDFFEPDGKGSRFSFTGAVETRLEALRNGCLSWLDPVSRGWFQQQHLASRLRFVELGLPGTGYRCMREFTNRAEADHRRLSHHSAGTLATLQAQQRMRQHAGASSATADLLGEEIAALGERLGALALLRRRQLPPNPKAELSSWRRGPAADRPGG